MAQPASIHSPPPEPHRVPFHWVSLISHDLFPFLFIPLSLALYLSPPPYLSYSTFLLSFEFADK